MNERILVLAALCFLAYLLGSIPFGYVLGRLFRKKDIRKIGSGNIGFANVKRAFGWGLGLATLAGDIAKGALPTVLARGRFPGSWEPLLVGFFAVAGHVWTIFLKFKGGKGVATSAGVFAALAPIPFAFALAAYTVTVKVFKYSSLGSLTGTVVLVSVLLIQWFTKWPWRPYGGTVIVGCAVAFLIFYLHRGNIARLARGEERKLVGDPRDYEKESP